MIRKIISSAAAFVLLCGAAYNVHAAEPKHEVQEAAAASYDSPGLAEYAEQVAVLVNRERAANGLQPLRLSPRLSEAASVRSGELKESFSHTRPDGTSCFTAMDELGISYRSAAENIAYGQRTPESVMDAWMNSSGHRANILSKSMEYIGVGVVYRDGIYYWTQLFAASDSLSDGAYLPEEESASPTTTAMTETSTTQTTTTVQTTTTAQAVTTASATSAETVTETQSATTTAAPVTTVQTTTAAPSATTAVQTTAAVQSTEAATDTSPETTQTTACPPLNTEPAVTTCKQDETAQRPIIITRPVITLPPSGECSVSVGGAVIVINPQ